MPVSTRTVMAGAAEGTRRFYPAASAPAGRAGYGDARAAGQPGRRGNCRRSTAVAVVQGVLEVADLALGAILLPAVLGLELARQVLGVALGLVEHVVGEVASLGLHLALQLLPVAGDDVTVHTCSFRLWSWARRLAGLGTGSPLPRWTPVEPPSTRG